MQDFQALPGQRATGETQRDVRVQQRYMTPAPLRGRRASTRECLHLFRADLHRKFNSFQCSCRDKFTSLDHNFISQLLNLQDVFLATKDDTTESTPKDQVCEALRHDFCNVFETHLSMSCPARLAPDKTPHHAAFFVMAWRPFVFAYLRHTLPVSHVSHVSRGLKLGFLEVPEIDTTYFPTTDVRRIEPKERSDAGWLAGSM